MAAVQEGDTVKVHYTGKLGDGTVFDSSEGREPLEFTVGAGDVIPGFEKAVVGMEPGERKEAEIPKAEAYGSHRDDMVLAVDREQLPEDADVEVGQKFQLRAANQEGSVMVRVTDVSGDQVTLDANHPLAGEDLFFSIKLEEIADKQE